jgi:hypothetical protein
MSRASSGGQGSRRRNRGSAIRTEANLARNAGRQNNDLVGLRVDRIENKERISDHRENPDLRFVGEMSKLRKFREQGRQLLDPFYHGRSGDRLCSEMYEKISSISASAVSDQRTLISDSD